MTVTLSPEVADLFANDFAFYAEHAPIKIADKETTELVPLRVRPAQAFVFKRCWQMAAAGYPVRMLIPKSRQLGITTGFAARDYWIAQVRERREIYMLIHDLTPAAKLWKRIEQMHKGINPNLRVELKAWETGRKFDFANDSNIMIESVRKRGVGRAETLHHVHATELPSWENADLVLNGIEESVPGLLNWESSIILESTCEGIGDHWYWLCKKAKDQVGMYWMAFLAWWLEQAYERDWRAGEQRKEPLKPDEEELGKRMLREAPGYGIAPPTPEQVIRKLLWRRDKRDQRGDAKFKQEYPMDLKEAFQGTGRTVFVSQHVRQHEMRMDGTGNLVNREAPHRLEVVQSGTKIVDGKKRRQYTWQKVEAGPLRMWLPPAPNGKYIVPGDFASGEHDDYTALHVLRVDNFPQVDQVAVWHGHINPVEAAYIQSYLALKYNNALMAPEVNGPGGIVCETHVSEIRRKGQKLYFHEVRDADSGEMKQRPGFFTGAQTRANIIEDFSDLLKTTDLILRCPQTLEEVEQFTWAKKTTGGTRAQAPTGAHDDLLMALMIGCYVRHTHRMAAARVVSAPGMDYSDFVPDDGSVRSPLQTTV